MSAVADVLNGAADLIERGGWVREHYCTEDGYCIAGAIDATVGIPYDTGQGDYDLAVFDRLWPVATEARRAVESIVHSNPTHWNDAPGRTKAEVVAALRAAAERAA